MKLLGWLMYLWPVAFLLGAAGFAKIKEMSNQGIEEVLVLATVTAMLTVYYLIAGWLVWG